HAQTAVFRGRIVDPMRAAIAGAHVTAVAEAAGRTTIAAADESGAFALELEPGTYKVTVSSPGFADAVRQVAIPGASAAEFVLQLASFTQSVEVAAKAETEGRINTSTKTPTLLRDTPQSVT